MMAFGARDVGVFQPCALRPEKDGHLTARRDHLARLDHGAFGRDHGFRQPPFPRRRGVDIGAIPDRRGHIVMQPRMVQKPPRTARQRHGAFVGPAVARGDHAHPVQPEIPHRAGRRPDILAHLRAHKDECGLAGGRRRLIFI
jgi:hypothetical protein